MRALLVYLDRTCISKRDRGPQSGLKAGLGTPISLYENNFRRRLTPPRHRAAAPNSLRKSSELENSLRRSARLEDSLNRAPLRQKHHRHIDCVYAIAADHTPPRNHEASPTLAGRNSDARIHRSTHPTHQRTSTPRYPGIHHTTKTPAEPAACTFPAQAGINRTHGTRDSPRRSESDVPRTRGDRPSIDVRTAAPSSAPHARGDRPRAPELRGCLAAPRTRGDRPGT